MTIPRGVIRPGEEEWVGKALSEKISDKVTWVKPPKYDFIYVIADKCSSCGLCYKFCSGGVYEYDPHTEKYVAARLNTCMECGTCYHVCPSDAIEWSYPPGGTGVIMSHS